MSVSEKPERELYDETCRKVISAVVTFARNISPAVDEEQTAKMFLAASSWLLLPAVGPGGTADMLRTLAAAIERGETRPTLN
jgi:hypothetical protein